MLELMSAVAIPSGRARPDRLATPAIKAQTLIGRPVRGQNRRRWSASVPSAPAFGQVFQAPRSLTRPWANRVVDRRQGKRTKKCRPPERNRVLDGVGAQRANLARARRWLERETVLRAWSPDGGACHSADVAMGRRLLLRHELEMLQRRESLAMADPWGGLRRRRRDIGTLPEEYSPPDCPHPEIHQKLPETYSPENCRRHVHTSAGRIRPCLAELNRRAEITPTGLCGVIIGPVLRKFGFGARGQCGAE